MDDLIDYNIKQIFCILYPYIPRIHGSEIVPDYVNITIEDAVGIIGPFILNFIDPNLTLDEKTLFHYHAVIVFVCELLLRNNNDEIISRIFSGSPEGHEIPTLDSLVTNITAVSTFILENKDGIHPKLFEDYSMKLHYLASVILTFNWSKYEWGESTIKFIFRFGVESRSQLLFIKILQLYYKYGLLSDKELQFGSSIIGDCVSELQLLGSSMLYHPVFEALCDLVIVYNNDGILLTHFLSLTKFENIDKETFENEMSFVNSFLNRFVIFNPVIELKKILLEGIAERLVDFLNSEDFTEISLFLDSYQILNTTDGCQEAAVSILSSIAHHIVEVYDCLLQSDIETAIVLASTLLFIDDSLTFIDNLRINDLLGVVLSGCEPTPNILSALFNLIYIIIIEQNELMQKRDEFNSSLNVLIEIPKFVLIEFFEEITFFNSFMYLVDGVIMNQNSMPPDFIAHFYDVILQMYPLIYEKCFEDIAFRDQLCESFILLNLISPDVFCDPGLKAACCSHIVNNMFDFDQDIVEIAIKWLVDLN